MRLIVTAAILVFLPLVLLDTLLHNSTFFNQEMFDANLRVVNLLEIGVCDYPKLLFMFDHFLCVNVAANSNKWLWFLSNELSKPMFRSLVTSCCI